MILWASEDGGTTWHRKPAHIVGGNRTFGRTEALAIDPQDPQLLYCVGTPEGFPLSHSANELYVSTNGGESFRLLRGDFYYDALLVIDPQDPLFLVSIDKDQYLISSHDGGVSWYRVGQAEELRKPHVVHLKDGTSYTYPKSTSYLSIVFDPFDTNTFYVVSSKGILKTMDRGGHWCLLNLGVDNAETMNSLLIDPKDNKTMYAGTWYGLFKTTDGGCSWKNLEVYKRIKTAKGGVRPLSR